MQKIIIILIIFLLTGCENNKHATCTFELEDKKISIDIDAINDDINEIHVRNEFILPNSFIMNDEYKKDLDSQLDSTYHYENNILVKEYDIELDDIYSYENTLKYLKTRRYLCE